MLKLVQSVIAMSTRIGHSIHLRIRMILKKLEPVNGIMMDSFRPILSMFDVDFANPNGKLKLIILIITHTLTGDEIISGSS